MTPSTDRPLILGLISDTHGLLRPEALNALQGVDHLIHAGDVGAPDILATLGALAPLTAVRGNNDTAAWAAGLPLVGCVSAGAVGVQVVHELPHLKPQALDERTRAVVYGHSHRPAIELRDGILYVNPGSAGPRRFKLPVTVARLRVHGTALEAEILTLL